ncbi:ribosomal large subunit pseudouridine synthase D [Thalassoporum mexicanum PCC 7367]|uniref:RluA family pseudouridine synthase n=1 Tax=Thalassoporum mexicanum TaxID=3457544 RepID=UPI00029FC34C|nr:RluA family pseudouridine synthase [Pseudanabaena sp. PCC 7367]AFY68668.1 ribosomal large subunit pseudouridine synthase D [Pseudanabaena sp. PCC 7367]
MDLNKSAENKISIEVDLNLPAAAPSRLVRLDSYLATCLTEFSRSRIQKLIEQGMVQQNQQTCTSKKAIVKDGDYLTIEIPELERLTIEPQAIDLDILYEDEHLLAINKPVGMVVHPAPGHSEGTLVNALLAHCQHLSGINGVQRPGIVHRLDKDTSGAIVVAKNDFAHHSLQAQIQAKTARRCYLGLVFGVPNASSGIINAPIARHQRDRKKMAVVETGRSAITHWRLLERLGHFSLLQFDLETGRTHQIRVHSAYMGHGIAGDPVYGKTLKHLKHQALHAWQLSFIHPVSQVEIKVTAPLPDYFEKILKQLRHRT